MDGSESEVDALSARHLRFVDGVLPMVLECAGHDEQRAMAQVVLELLLMVILAPELEGSRSTEGNGGNRGVRAQLSLSVLMPTDAVAFIPV